MLYLIVRGLAKTAFWALCFVGMTMLVMHFNTSRLRIQVGSHLPDSFPVLVVSKENNAYTADIVLAWALPEYLRSKRDYSFEVPLEERVSIVAAVARRTAPADIKGRIDSSERTAFGVGGFSVRPLPEGRQALRVDGTWDDDRANTGWYVAKAKDLTPQYYLCYFGPGQVLKALPEALGLCVLIWVAIRFVGRRIRRAVAPIPNT